MTLEHFILVAITAVSIASVFYIPRNKYRLALISFCIFQTLTWAVTIILVQIGSIEYPVREFSRATQVGFLTNYIFFPMVYVWYILLFPSIAFWAKKILYFFIFISIIVWFIYFTAVYTDLENLKRGTPHSQIIRLYINFSIDFIICHIYISWFSKKEALLTGEINHVSN
ncbi:MAG: hypothetical protein K0R50_4105 [Eubacterium sp.]|nr:hypothetical protein [Eubacterium sp.]